MTVPGSCSEGEACRRGERSPRSSTHPRLALPRFPSLRDSLVPPQQPACTAVYAVLIAASWWALHSAGPSLASGPEQTWPASAFTEDSMGARSHVEPVAGPIRADDGVGRASRSTALDCGRDAYVSSDQPDSSFGSDPHLYVGVPGELGVAQSLLWFETQALPSDQVVTDARLRLHLSDAGPSWDSSRAVATHRLGESWLETGVTWNRMPDFDDDKDDEVSVGLESGWHEWDLTELVQRWRWPDRPWYDWHLGNYGILLRGHEDAGSYRRFDSIESSDGPQLRLTHTADNLAPVGTLEAIPSYHRQAAEGAPDRALIRLHWRATDPPPATGVDYFRLDVQRNHEPWVSIPDQLRNSTGGLFEGENGKRYGFRIQAADMAGNMEPETQAEVQTLVDLSAPVSRVDDLPDYSRGPFTLSWSGYDEPVGGADIYSSGVLSYTVHYSVGNGPWGPLWRNVATTSGRFDPRQGVTYRFQVTAIDRAGNYEQLGEGEAGTHVDWTAPLTWFEKVRGCDRATFEVSWQGWDPGGSGIVSYDVQYRRDGGTWQDWLMRTAMDAASFTGEFSHVYGFRCRARDIAGNESAYPAAAQLTVGVLDREILVHATYLPVLPSG